MSAEKQENFNLKARDDRFFRAAYTVLEHYRIRRRPELEDGFVVFDICGGTSDYVVRIQPEWKCPPACSCPDAEKRARESTRGYCKHIIAVLLREKEFGCQLLEAFL